MDGLGKSDYSKVSDGVKDKRKACSSTPVVIYGVKEDDGLRWRLLYRRHEQMGCSGGQSLWSTNQLLHDGYICRQIST